MSAWKYGNEFFCLCKTSAAKEKHICHIASEDSGLTEAMVYENWPCKVCKKSYKQNDSTGHVWKIETFTTNWNSCKPERHQYIPMTNLERMAEGV